MDIKCDGIKPTPRCGLTMLIQVISLLLFFSFFSNLSCYGPETKVNKEEEQWTFISLADKIDLIKSD